MWSVKIPVVFLVGVALVEADMSPNYFCADMMPQQHVNIEQLMGMWYGIELIPQNPDTQHYTIIEPSCPIVHISEERYYPPSTYTPLHKNYGYDYNYGEKRDHNYGERRDYNYNQRDRDRNTDQYQRRRQQEYGRTTPSYDTYYNRRYGSTNGYLPKYAGDMKKLRIWWDENGSGTEYHVRYNVTRPGFWLSSGPQNGSELEPQYSHFAGTVQVIKAVGNHLVLTFCHQMPDRRLFTVLLSREHKLDEVDIRGVHSLLNRKGLSTASIKKVCSNRSHPIRSATNLVLVLVTLTLAFRFS